MRHIDTHPHPTTHTPTEGKRERERVKKEHKSKAEMPLLYRNEKLGERKSFIDSCFG